MGYNGSSSLPVLSVQEMVRNDAQQIPEGFIKKPEDRPTNSEICSHESKDIPVVDFSLLAKGDEDERRKLDFACQEWGFFQMINHGADEALLKMKAAVAAFFDLPLSEKKKYAKPANDFQGYGQDNKYSEDKILDWNDFLWLVTMPPECRKFNYWPLTLPGFKESIEEYGSEIQRVSNEILSNLSLLMGVERDFLKQLHGNVIQGVRMNYYPTCARPDLVLGLSPHSDNSSISLVSQDDEIIALQLKHKGVWVPVDPIPNAIAVLIGDAMEPWSNGKYKSVEHRTVANVEKPRLSVVSFVIPGGEVQLDPLKTMVDDDHPRIYRNGIKYGDYLIYARTREMEEDYHNVDYLKM